MDECTTRMTKKVTPVEINLSNDGTTITYVFALEAGTESGFSYSVREDYMQDEVVLDLYNKIGQYKLGWTEDDTYSTIDEFFIRSGKTEQEKIAQCRYELDSFGTDFVYQGLKAGIEKQDKMVDVLSNVDSGLGYFTMIVDDVPVLGIISDALSITVDLYSLYQGNQKEQLKDAIIDGRFNIIFYRDYSTNRYSE